MTFSQNSLKLSNESLCLDFNTTDFLHNVSRNDLPIDIHLKDSENEFWKDKSQSLGFGLKYDWSYWTSSVGKIYSQTGGDTVEEVTNEEIDFKRLSSTMEPIRFFDQILFYEDEMADNGSSHVDLCIVITSFTLNNSPDLL